MNVRVWRGRAFSPWEAGDIDPSDRGLMLGDGVFETMRVSAEGGVRRGDAHRARLAGALAALDLPAAPDWASMERAACAMAAELGGAAAVRLTVTRGPGPRGLAPFQPQKPVCLLSAAPLAAAPIAISLATSAIRRDPTSPSNRYKTLSRADAAAARREAVSKSADMALMLASDGMVSGCDAANLFWIADGALHTPGLDCAVLPGVTRGAVLHLAAAEGVRAEEGRFGPEALLAAEAAFVTNALTGAVAVSAIDGRAMRIDHPLLSLAAMERGEAVG